MYTSRQFAISMFLTCALGVSASAEVLLEIIGSTELTVHPATVNSPTDVFPFQGEPLIVWAQLSNMGAQPFEATGPGGVGGSASGGFLWSEFPGHLWDPLADPDDPLVETPLGYRGVVLGPGESVAVPILEVWGIDLTGTHPLYSASIGSVTTFSDVTMSFWAGLDRDPNDPLDPLDVSIPLDTSFTVTVIPEPSIWLMISVATLMTMTARRGVR